MATTATARRAHRPRTVAPKATPQAEVPATNTTPSFWSRVKTAAKKVAHVIAKPFKAVATKTKSIFVKKSGNVTYVRGSKMYHGAKARVVRAYYRVTDALRTKAVPSIKAFWRRALQPLLAGVAGGLALFGIIVAALVAPLTTALCLFGAAFLTLALARGMQYLEEIEGTSRAARIMLRSIDIVVRACVVLVYAASAFVVVALSVTSWTFALFIAAFLALAYFQVRGAASVAFMLWATISGHWSLALLWALFFVARIPARDAVVSVPEYSEIRRKPEVHETVVRARDARPAGSFLRAKGTEELWGTEWDKAPEAEDPDQNWADVWVNDKTCSACGTDKGAMRAKSHRRAGDGETEAWLCSDCYDHECEDDAMLFTGVSLKARSVEVHLNQAGIEASKEYAQSKAEPDENVWLDAMWWRDRDGNEYLRERILLRDGLEVARIKKDHKRGSFRAVVLDRVVGGPKKTAVEAQALAQDELDREQAVVRRYEEAAAEIAGEGPARQAKKA